MNQITERQGSIHGNVLTPTINIVPATEISKSDVINTLTQSVGLDKFI